MKKSTKPLKRKAPLKASLKVIGEKTHGRRYFTSAEKRTILERDGWECQGCGVSLGFDNAAADHIEAWPVGKTEVENGQSLCLNCNRLKSRQSDEAFQSAFRTYSMQDTDHVS